MSWPRAVRLRRRARRLACRFAPGALVLLYHRVAEADSDPWRLCVHPRHFAEQLEVLRGSVLPLAELVGAAAGRPPAAGKVALTFDDGYAETLRTAQPLLERHGLPATVFVATGAVEDGRPFWWDELEALLLGSQTPSGVLELRANGTRRRFELADASRPDATTPRERLRRELHGCLAGLEDAERRESLAALRAWADPGQRCGLAPPDRGLRGEEVARLAARGLFEIGAHTVSHPRLPGLLPESQRREVAGSRTCLEGLSGRPVRSFAYPHGAHDAATRRIVREAGFERACTTDSGLVRAGTDRFRLPRLPAPDVGGELFARWLSGYGMASAEGASRRRA